MRRACIITAFLLTPVCLSSDKAVLLCVKDGALFLDIYRDGDLTKSQPVGLVTSFGNGGGSIYTLGIADETTMRARLEIWDKATGEISAHHPLEGTAPGWVQGPIEQVIYDARRGLVSFVTFNLVDAGIRAMLNVVDVTTNQGSVYEIPIGKRFPVIAAVAEGIVIYQQRFENLLLFDLDRRAFGIYDLEQGETVSFDHIGTFEMSGRGNLVDLTASTEVMSDLFKMAPEDVGVRIGSFRVDASTSGALFQREVGTGKTLSVHTSEAAGWQHFPLSFEAGRILSMDATSVLLFDRDRQAIVALDVQNGRIRSVLEVGDDTHDVLFLTDVE